MSRYPWFRVYNEILTERKIERIGRMTHLPRVVIRGAWMTILAMANDSPKRGYLMWTDELWITETELCDDLEMEPDDFSRLLDAFVKMSMVTRHQSGGLSCTNFGKRQFKSDHSTPRVHKHRAAKQVEETGSCNVSETLHSNGPEAEADSDTDPEADADAEPPAATAMAETIERWDRLPYRENPEALQTYYTETDCGLSKSWQARVEKIVGTSQKDLTFWRHVITGWLSTPWSPNNIFAILQRYERRDIPGSNGSQPTGPPPTGPPEPTVIHGFHDTPEWLGGSSGET